MFRRLLSDKKIGTRLKQIIRPRFYYVSSSEWELYTNNLISTKSRDFLQNNNNNINSDLSVSILKHNDDIKHIQKDIFDLYKKINKLTNIVNNNPNNSGIN